MGYALTIAGPLLAFVCAWFGVWSSRRSSLELDRWRRREETMRLLRWAAEMACGSDAHVELGLATLDGLRRSELLQHEDVDLVDAVITVLLDRRVRASGLHAGTVQNVEGGS